MRVEIHITNISSAPKLAASFSEFSLAGVDGIVDVDGARVEVTVPHGTDVTDIAATFTTEADETTVKVGNTEQTSGTTKNDFSEPVVYTLIGPDETTTRSWTVIVTEAAE